MTKQKSAKETRLDALIAGHGKLWLQFTHLECVLLRTVNQAETGLIRGDGLEHLRGRIKRLQDIREEQISSLHTTLVEILKLQDKICDSIS